MRQNSSTRLVLKMAEEKAKFRGIPRLVLEKAEGKGKIPRLVLDLGKILPKVSSSTSSSPDDPSRTSVVTFSLF